MLQTAYGLTIASELPLPELPLASHSDGPADVTIRLGTVPDRERAQGQRIGPISWVAGDSLTLNVPQIARYCATAGSTIVIDPVDGIDDDSIRVFLLGSMMGALLLQRGLLLLHGCAVEVDGKSLVAVGPSGSGKSTLTEGFRRRGHAILADDLVAINADGAALPGIPRIKLWHDVTEQLAIDRTALPRIRPNLEKFAVPVAEAMAQGPLPVASIYALGTHHGDEVVIRPLDGFARFNLLLENSYRQRFVKGLGRRPQHLAQATRLAGQIRARVAERPNLGFTLEPLIDALLADARA